MNLKQVSAFAILLIATGCASSPRREYVVKHVTDFEVTGTGSAPAWQQAPWMTLGVLQGSLDYRTRAKALYSDAGVYLLFHCEDDRLTSPFKNDFENLYDGDVVEAFFWPDERERTYFEYEIAPTGLELPLLVANTGTTYMGWLPWQYTAERKVRKATSVTGGRKEHGAEVGGWSAEVFIPFALLRGLNNVPPKPRSRWRTNLYRIDYDAGPKNATFWTWNPLKKVDYHRIDEFGTFVFGKR